MIDRCSLLACVLFGLALMIAAQSARVGLFEPSIPDEIIRCPTSAEIGKAAVSRERLRGALLGPN